MENEDNSSGWCGSDGDSTGCSPPNAGGFRVDRPQKKEFAGHSRKPSASSLGAFNGTNFYGTDSGIDSGTPQSRVSSAPIHVTLPNSLGLSGSPPGTFYCPEAQGTVEMSPMHPYGQRRTPTSNP